MPIRVHLANQPLRTLIRAPKRRVAQEEQLLGREIQTGE